MFKPNRNTSNNRYYNEAWIKRLEKNKEYTGGVVNCWGTTLLILNVAEEPQWIETEEMQEFLENNTWKVEINEIEVGDIAAFYDSTDTLIHTATIVDKDKYFHKPGTWKAEYANLARMFSIYEEISVIKFLRYKGTKK